MSLVFYKGVVLCGSVSLRGYVELKGQGGVIKVNWLWLTIMLLPVGLVLVEGQGAQSPEAVGSVLYGCAVWRPKAGVPE